MALKVVKGKQKPKYTAQEVSKMAQEYAEISAQMKLLDTTKKSLADKLKEASEQIGVKDSKGSYYYEAGEYITGKVAKKSISLKQDETIKLLKKKGLYEQCVNVQTVEVINEKALSEAVSNGTITQSEFEDLCDVKVTYSVSVQKVEEMPEVDTTHALKAASKKKK